MNPSSPLLEVKDLHVRFGARERGITAVNGVSFHVGRGETLAVVGESGSGKSVTSLAVMRLLSPPGHVASGDILFDGEDLLAKTDREMQRVRGNRIGMIFQEPMTSLNPVYTIGHQISEAILLHQRGNRARAMSRAVELLDLVGISEPRKRASSYPHEISGGMRQRAMIAMALSCNPQLLIADEPTTALDVTIQAQILDLMHQLQKEFGMSVLFITHDLGVVAEVADRVVVMYAGQVVEEGDVGKVFAQPRMPYTLGLLGSVPRIDRAAGHKRLTAIPGSVPVLTSTVEGCLFGPRCAIAQEVCREARPALVDTGAGHMSRCLRWPEVGQPRPQQEPASLHAANGARAALPAPGADDGPPILEVKDLSVEFRSRAGIFGRRGESVKAVQNLSFSMRKGEALGLVGESGSGKTTAGRAILRLVEPHSGTVRFDGQELSGASKAEVLRLRRKMQVIFQDPLASLNPRMKVEDVIGEPLDIHKLETGEKRRERIAELMRRVGLPHESMDRYPHEFSGGQRQRIVIARALAVSPSFIVADEPVSALDVSIRAQVINLLQELKDDLDLTILFISHDLGVVEHFCDRVMVLYLGRVMEVGPTERLYANPAHPYTRALLSAVPVPDPSVKRESVPITGEIPSPVAPPSGCVFRTRCPIAAPRCAKVVPTLEEVAPGHFKACIMQ